MMRNAVATAITAPAPRIVARGLVHMMVVTFSTPVGQLVLGWIMEWTNPRATIVGAGALMAVATAFLIVTGRLHSLDDA